MVQERVNHKIVPETIDENPSTTPFSSSFGRFDTRRLVGYQRDGGCDGNFGSGSGVVVCMKGTQSFFSIEYSVDSSMDSELPHLSRRTFQQVTLQ